MATTRREFRSTGIAIGSDTKPSALNAPLQSERDEDEMAAAGVRNAAKKVPSGVVDAVAVRTAGPPGCAMVLLCPLAIATLSNGDGGEGASTHSRRRTNYVHISGYPSDSVAGIAISNNLSAYDMKIILFWGCML
jgi:hypothetical protein